MAVIDARLSKSKAEPRRVLCGYADCGAMLALLAPGPILPVSPEEEVDLTDPMVKRSQDPARPDLILRQHPLSFQFRPGWVQGDDGIWELTKHSRQRLRWDSRLASSHTVSPSRGSEARRRLAFGRSSAFRRPFVRGYPNGDVIRGQIAPYTLPPCLTRCPTCGRINLLAASLVGTERPTED